MVSKHPLFTTHYCTHYPPSSSILEPRPFQHPPPFPPKENLTELSPDKSPFLHPHPHPHPPSVSAPPSPPVSSLLTIPIDRSFPFLFLLLLFFSLVVRIGGGEAVCAFLFFFSLGGLGFRERERGCWLGIKLCVLWLGPFVLFGCWGREGWVGVF